MRRLLLASLAALLVLPAGAGARVVIVAGGDGAATLTDVTTNRVVARIALGGRTRAAAAAPDGSRGFVASGNRVVAIDLATRAVVGSATVGGPVTALAVSRDGQRLYAARRGALDVIDAGAMVARARIDLGARASGAALAVSGDATRALVVLDAKSVGVVDLVRFQLHRRIKLPGATGAAFAPTGSTV